MRVILAISFLCAVLKLHAQSPAQVDQDFYFNNGVYLSFEDFQNNAPALSWNALDAEAHIDGNEHLVRFSEILMYESREPIDIGTVWGVSIEGKPYLNINRVKGEERLRSSGEDPVLFVRMQAIGNLCYFFYEAYITEKVAIHVYDPRTGVRLRTGMVENQKPVAIKKILEFETGKVSDYNLTNFKELISDDKALWNTLNELSDTEARTKMYRSLFIYNERNPVYINTKS